MGLLDATTLPGGFAELERWVPTWVQPTRDERYAVRLATPIDEITEFYDAIAARAEDAMAHLDGLDQDDLSDESYRLQHLLYSMILVAYAVNVFKQPHVPDSGSAFFSSTVEPAV